MMVASLTWLTSFVVVLWSSCFVVVVSQHGDE
jgi:hypothetical protein